MKKQQNKTKQIKQTNTQTNEKNKNSPGRDGDQSAEHTVVRGGDVDVAEAEVGDDDGGDARNASSKRRVHPKKRKRRGEEDEPTML